MAATVGYGVIAARIKDIENVFYPIPLPEWFKLVECPCCSVQNRLPAWKGKRKGLRKHSQQCGPKSRRLSSVRSFIA